MARSAYSVPLPVFDETRGCGGRDPELWFPLNELEAAEPKRLCRGCPFVRPCLAYAVTHEVDGIWGATTTAERRALRHKHGLVAVPVRGLTTNSPSTASEDTT